MALAVWGPAQPAMALAVWGPAQTAVIAKGDGVGGLGRAIALADWGPAQTAAMGWVVAVR